MRRNRAPKRDVLLDPIFNSIVITKLVNTIMLDGKKGVAQNILYSAFDLIKEKTKEDSMVIFNKALENIRPSLEVRTRRIGGTNYQVPVDVSSTRKQTLTLRWLVKYSRLRNEYTMPERLANEIIDASKGVGASVKKREDTHKMAEANKAFAHFRW